MPAQIRSAYPRFPDALTPRDLERHFTLSDSERQLADAHARGAVPLLTFLVLLKGIQYLAYFPEVTSVPDRVVVEKDQGCLQFDPLFWARANSTRFQVEIASSSRSAATRCGRWQLQPIRFRTCQTPLSV